MEGSKAAPQTAGGPRRSAQWAGLLGVFAALCTIFVLIVSASEAFREHAEQTWPEASATIQRCSVDSHVPLRSHSAVWYIRCRIQYSADGKQIATSIESRSTRSGWGGRLGEMRQWVADHRAGSPMVIHYDPANTSNAVLTATDMPYGGPRTSDNLKLLLIAGSVSVVLIFVSKQLNRPSEAT